MSRFGKNITLYLFCILQAFIWFIVLIPVDQPDFSFHIQDVANKNTFVTWLLYPEIEIYRTCANLDVSPMENMLSGVRGDCAFFTSMVRTIRYICSTLTIYYVTKKLFKSDSVIYLLCFATPGFIQIASFHSLESVYLIISVVFVRVQVFAIHIIVFLIGVLFFDMGAAFIYCLFIIYKTLWERVFTKTRLILFAFMFVILYFVLMVGLDIISYLEFIPIYGQRLYSVWEAYSTVYSYVYDNYPIVLRPVLTFSGFFLLTPQAHGTVWVGLFCYLVFLGLTMKLLYKFLIDKSSFYDEKDNIAIHTFLPSIIFITACVCLMPGYSNAKYYIFVLPLIFEGLRSFCSLKVVFWVILILQAISLIVHLTELSMQINIL
jgi:hypothetical protein